MKASNALMSLLLSLVLMGCGGGGGEETAEPDTTIIEPDTTITPLAYTGNTEPSLLTTINAKLWVDLFFGSDDSSTNLYEDPALSSKKNNLIGQWIGNHTHKLE